MTIEQLTRRYTIRVYLSMGKNKRKTAKALGIGLKTLYNWLNNSKWREELERIETRTRNRQQESADTGKPTSEPV
jgi:transposase